MVKDQTERLGELAPRVTEHRDHGARRSLRIRPAGHDRAVVHAIDQDIRNSLCLQFILFAQIARHLRRGSGRGEGAWKANQDDFFALAKIAKHKFLWRETFVKADVGDRVTDFHGRGFGGCFGCSSRRSVDSQSS